MTAEKYVTSILKKIQCNRTRKNDIKKQLLSDINERLASGEKLEDIIAEMGNVDEVAEGFNENISDDDRKKYKRSKTLKICLCVIAVLVLLAFIIKQLLPNTKPLEDSKIFNKQQVEESLIQVIDLVDQQEYETLQSISIPQMKAVFNAPKMSSIMTQMGGAFGNRQSVGKIYSYEVVQNKQHFAVGQVTVSYENTSITYTISFDEEMKVAGFFLK